MEEKQRKKEEEKTQKEAHREDVYEGAKRKRKNEETSI